MVKKYNKKMKCAMDNCNKKTKLTDFDCRCNKRFCALHRLPETHECSFNFKKVDNTIDENILMKKKGLGGGIARKIEII